VAYQRLAYGDFDEENSPEDHLKVWINDTRNSKSESVNLSDGFHSQSNTSLSAAIRNTWKKELNDQEK